MDVPRTSLLASLLLTSGALFGQEPIRLPYQTREPPLADERPADRARNGSDADEDADVKPAQYVVPGRPAVVPGNAPGGSAVLPAQYVQPVGTLPTPLVTLDVEGSDVVSTGHAVVYKLYVRNQSRAKAHNVVVKVVPPKDVAKVKADPPPTHEDAESQWEFKTLDPGQSRTIEVSYRPNAGVEEVKIQARVQFDFGRGMITKVAPPTLSVKKEGPENLVVGDTATYRITVANTGKVTVRDIEVKDMLSKGLQFDDREIARGAVDGRLMSSIDRKKPERTWSGLTLGPGQSRVFEYRVKAEAPGRLQSTVHVTAGELLKEAGLDVEVMTATLQMSAEGPEGAQGSVGQPARYQVTVANRGSAVLRNVTVRCVCPPDMHPRKVMEGAEAIRDGVQWVLKELKPGDNRTFTVALVTTSPGNRTVRFTAKAHRGEEQTKEVRTSFAGLANLDWDVEAPAIVSVGRETTYRVTVANRGSATGRALVRVDLPMSFDLRDESPRGTRGVGQNANEVRFEEEQIGAGRKRTYVVRVNPRVAGEVRVGFTLFEDGKEAKKDSKVTNVVESNTRSPTGPPPAGGVDRSKVGSSPRE
jgi:uncharacterized repeat protein (TIGR01451 family)